MRCDATTVDGFIQKYRRYCRLEGPHPAIMHRDGGFTWGNGAVSAAVAMPVEDDIGQGEGCEGGKCAVGTKL